MPGTQRIKALLENKPIDRTPVAGWFHMPLVDTNVEDFSRALISSIDYNEWDIIKVMTNGHFMPEAYGAVIDFSRNPAQWFGVISKYPIRDPGDASSLKVLNAKTNPVFQRETAVIKNLAGHYKGTIPILATIFNPITSFQEMNSTLNPTITKIFLKHHKNELHNALTAITQTIKNYLDELIAAGIDGIFFANQYASRDLLSDDDYDEFITPYDTQIIEYIASRTWFNMAHIHGKSNLNFTKYKGLPYQALNWENTPRDVPISAVSTIRVVQNLFPGTILVTGLDQHNDFFSPLNKREEVKKVLKKRYKDAVQELGSNRFVFAPGCSLPLDVPNYLFTLLREIVEEG
jgi:uroporphyrinogen decarboxylase